MRILYIMMALAAALFAAEDPGGWSRAKWGMTDQQIIDAFAGQAVRLDPPDEVSGVKVRVAVPVELAETKLRALMVPDPDGRLSAVLLTAELSDQTDLLFQSLQDLLVQKYGRPWKDSEEDGTSELQWTLRTTVITLTRSKLPLTTQRLVTLRYARKSPDLDKL